MAPVHADELDRAFDGMYGQVRKDVTQERRKFFGTHLAGSKRKLSVFCVSESADVTIDPHIVRRVGEDHLRSFAIEQSSVRFGLGRVATDQPM